MGATYNPAAEKIFRETFQQAGLPPVAIAAWMSRFKAESAFDPNALRKDDAGPGNDSVGAGQWNRDRKKALEKFAADQGGQWNDPSIQAQFALSEIGGTHSFIGEKFKNAKTLQDAVDAAVMYENPKGASKRVDGKTVWTPRNALAYQKTLDEAKKYYSGENPSATNIMSNVKDVVGPSDSTSKDKSASAEDTSLSGQIASIINDTSQQTNKDQQGVLNPMQIETMIKSFLPTQPTAKETPKTPGIAEMQALFGPKLQWAGL